MSFSFDKREKQDDYTYHLFFKEINEKTLKNFQHWGDQFTQHPNFSYGPNVVTDSIVTLYRLHILPVGNYMFHNFMIAENFGNITYEMSQPASFNIPFDVVEKKICYIGDYRFVKKMKKAAFGKVMKDGLVIASNRMPRDLQKVQTKKFSSLDFSGLIVQPPHFGDTSALHHPAIFIED